MAGVGASAGGLEAITRFLEGLADAPNFAIVFIAHLGPTQRDGFLQVLRRSTQLPVESVEAGGRPVAGTIHVVPAATLVTLDQGRFRVQPARAASRPPHTIDTFLRSLAADETVWPIGVVLSGTLADGTDGLAAVRAGGGIALAQDPKTAKFEAMPVNAIASGQVDSILPPEEMGPAIARMAQAPARAGPRATEASPDWLLRTDLSTVLALLRASHGLDLQLYKPATLRRRLLRRMVIANRKTVASYVQLLKSTPSELDALAQDLLINVTSFFREPAAFDEVARVVLPKILKDRDPRAPIRIWVPGCATGEEVYSIAILLREYLSKERSERLVQIFGTDVSEESLARAREGIYSKAIETQMSAERLERFFVKTGESYAVHASIRDQCMFARHNVLADPPFSRMDLVSCRNLLIYLNTEGQRTAVGMFHFALNPGGFLLLGAAETIPGVESMFSLAGPQGHLYARKDKAARPRTRVAWRRASDDQLELPGPFAPTMNAARLADQMLMDRYAPPGVLINDGFEIERFIGNTASVLEHRAGQPTMNLLQMAREALSPHIAGLIDRVRRTGRVAVKTGLHVSGNRRIDLRVVPVGPPQTKPEHYMVLFESAAAREQGPPGPTKRSPAKADREHRRAKLLERQLREMREFLRSSLQQQDAINDQLKVASEELQSRNEELQSMNEELQTAKEELQSTNEELLSTNEELNVRNQEIVAINTELTNLVAGTDLPIVMLDREIRIRRYSPAAGAEMNLRPSDLGRPMTDLNVNFPLGDILRGFAQSMEDGLEHELEVRHKNGTTFLMRIVPFMGVGGRVDGAVLHFGRPA